MTNNIINAAGTVGKSGQSHLPQVKSQETKDTFTKLVKAEIEELKGEVKLSSHVQKRLEERQITLDPELAGKISDAFQKAEAKGVKESLLVINDLALIASIKNKTIVTAVDGTSMKDRVFTNIDSAIIVK